MNMKKYIYYILCLGLFIAMQFSCSEDDLSSTSVIPDDKSEKNEFDKWIEANYIIPYNIDFKYRFDDKESDMNYNLEPANKKKAIRMAKMIQHLVLGTYDEHTGSRDFIRAYYPKILFMVGSPAYNNNGTIVLATAENGYKITINNVNYITLADITEADIVQFNRYYFKTLHHEFAHILHQTKPYSPSFKEISGASYVQDSWNTKYTDQSSLLDGFITAYASKAQDEDFVELYSVYITSTEEQWKNKLVQAKDSGALIINSKLDIVTNYIEGTWKLDMDSLRKIVLRRQSEILNLDLDTLN